MAAHPAYDLNRDARLRQDIRDGRLWPGVAEPSSGVNQLRRRTWMAGDDRIEALRAKHAKLESEIDDEFHRPMPDDAHIAELKREKLRIKDEISRIAGTH